MQRLLMLGLVAAVAVAMMASGLGGWFSDGESVETFLRDRGWVGPVVFVLVMWALQPVGVPGAVFMVPAALVWPAPAAMALSWIGNMGASFIAFAFARWIARDWAQARLPDRIRRWDARLADGKVIDVVILRVFTGQLPPADWLLGISSVRIRPFFIGTGIGIIPVIVIVVLAGASVGGWFFADPVRWGTALVVLVTAVVGGRLRARREPNRSLRRSVERSGDVS